MNWDVCVEQLAAELTAEQLNTWIKPLQVEEIIRFVAFSLDQTDHHNC